LDKKRYSRDRFYDDMGGRLRVMLTHRIVAGVLVVIIVAVLASSFLYTAFIRKDWHKDALNQYQPIGPGFYQLSWDSQNDLQLAYSNGGALVYGVRVDGSWSLSLVAGFSSTLEGVSLALDSRDIVHICSYSLYSLSQNQTERAHILYANNEDGEWHLSTITTTGYCTSSEVFVDENDTVHILYTEHTKWGSWPSQITRYTLFDLTQTEAGWNKTPLIDVAAPDVYLRIEDIDKRHDGTVGILYTSGYLGYSPEVEHYTLLNYSVDSAGTLGDPFSISSITNLRGRISLCHDLAGNAFIAGYREVDSGFNISFVSNRQGSWSVTDVADAGTSLGFGGDSGTSIAIGTDDSGKYEHSVRYSTNREGDWSTRIVDDCRGSAGHESIAVLPDNEEGINIVYYFYEHHKNKGDSSGTIYATNDWQSEDYLSALSDSCFKAFVAGGVASVVLFYLLFRQKRRCLEEICNEGRSKV
jgi:hypothetical protein